MDAVDVIVGTIVTAFILGFFTLIGVLIYHDIAYDSQEWTCQTKYAKMINTTEDNNLHITLFCVKDGVIVP